MNNCTMCHGANRAATNVLPSLLNPGARITPQKADSVLKKGGGQMPSYPDTMDGAVNNINKCIRLKLI